MERARAMLLDAELDKKYWTEAARTAIYLKNRSPTQVLKQVMLEEAWTGEKDDASNLKSFWLQSHDAYSKTAEDQVGL
jgi:hypothetical protein